MRSRPLLLILSLVPLIAGCGDSTEPNGNADPCQVLRTPGSPNASFTSAGLFKVSPIDTASISSIIPLGNINPPNHVYPTDHMYFLPKSTVAGANAILAAAPGTVIDLYQPGGTGTDWKVIISADKSFYYYYDHISPVANLKIGSAVTAGQVLGTNSGLGAAVDFGVYNFNNAPVAGILNACAITAEAYVDSPLKYYSGALQTSLYDKVTVKAPATKDGKFDYDQKGNLSGNWVRTGHLPTESTQYALAFVYNVVDHSLRISAGSLLGGGGTFGVQTNAADWSTITVNTGQVNLRLFPTTQGDQGTPGPQFGVLAVQVLTTSQIKVEMFVGNTTGAATFTANAITYDR